MSWERRLVLVGVALTTSAAALVVGAVVGALATSEPGITATRRFEFLSRAADPVPALLVLLGVLAILAAEDGGGRRPLLGRIAVGLAAFFGVVIVLLAVNGILLDLTTDGASVLVRLSRVVFLRVGPILLAAGAVWLSLSAPAPRDSPAPRES